jgi:hypothetical protein
VKALFGVISEFGVADFNRLLKPHGVRLVVKKSKDWGKNVSVTAHPVGAAAKRSRAAKPSTASPNAGPDPVTGVGAAG